MEHSDAIRLKAAEQYLLGEISGDLRAEFEEHFMSCAECAADLRAGVMFVESARDVFRSQASELVAAKTAGPSRGWLAWILRPAFAVPAFAVLLAIIGYQSGVVIPRLESSASRTAAPRALTSFSLIDSNARGEGAAAFIVQPDQPFSLYADVPPQPSFPVYTLRVESEAGAAQFAVSISADEARNTVQILVPASRLTPGPYALVVRGASGSGDAQGAELARYNFSIAYAHSSSSSNP